MSEQLMPKSAKKRSFSQLPKNNTDSHWHFRSNTSRTNLPTLAQTQLIQTISNKQQKNVRLTKERVSVNRLLIDQRAENQGLRQSIKQTMEKVKYERKEGYLTKDQLFVISQDKVRIEKDYRSIVEQFKVLQQKYLEAEKRSGRIESEKEEAESRLRKTQSKFTENSKLNQQQLLFLREDYQRLSRIAKDQGLAVERIKVLQAQLRQIKLDKGLCQQSIQSLERQLKQSEEALKSVRPEWEKQNQRIKYFERVVSDLQKKAEEFYRKQYEVNKEMEKLNKERDKESSGKDYFKNLLEKQQAKLKSKESECQQLTTLYTDTSHRLDLKSQQLDRQLVTNRDLEARILELVEQLRLKEEEMRANMVKIAFLEEHQLTVKSSVQQVRLISAESNKFVHNRDMQAYKLKQDKQYLSKKIEELAQRYRKFDECYLESSTASKNKLKDSVVAYVRTCSKIEVDMSELKKTLDCKDLSFMEERDMLRRDLELQSQQLPQDPTLYEQVFMQKNQLIRALENSNAQLLKSAAGEDDIVRTFEEQNYRLEIDIVELKRDIGQLKKLQKEVCDLRNRQRDQQASIAELNKEKKDVEQRLIKRTEQFADANLKIRDLQKQVGLQLAEIHALNNRSHTKIPANQTTSLVHQPPKVEDQKDISLQLKEQAMVDALQKMSNAIKSVQLYFSCNFCDDIVDQPYTVHPCGHHYCQKCREGFDQECSECSNGMPIHGVFKNPHLQGALPRFKFLCMVFESASRVFIKEKKGD